MESHSNPENAPVESRSIGVSRPPLPLQDLPTPEEVFGTKRIGRKELITLVLGPSLIALGASLGSGEWLLGPLAAGKYGFVGIGWVITVSAILQLFYNVELGRFTIATGETPVVAFGRTPPGFRFWVPFAVFCTYMAFIWGGWAASAGASLFALFAGRPHTPEELEIVRILGIALLFGVFLIVSFGKRIERTLEIVNGVIVSFVLVTLILVTLIVVPLDFWAGAFASLVTPAAPPRGTDPSLLGALAGFTAFASGLNFVLINYYRDKGYGMGHRTGYIASLIGGKQEQVLPSGVTFPENERNAALWKRWFRFLVIDQWVVFFIGAILGMMIPSILIGYLSTLPGAPPPETATIPTYAATQLGPRYGSVFFYWALLVGFFALFSTQMVMVELLVRNFTDAAHGVSARFRKWTREDPRRFYYPFMLLLIVVIGLLIHAALPAELIVISANLSNLAAMFFPIVMIYLNRQLPRPARITWWSYLVLALNTVFFGFFFLNFLVVQLTGTPLVRF